MTKFRSNNLLKGIREIEQDLDDSLPDLPRDIL